MHKADASTQKPVILTLSQTLMTAHVYGPSTVLAIVAAHSSSMNVTTAMNPLALAKFCFSIQVQFKTGLFLKVLHN
jgi:hypothetical protein